MSTVANRKQKSQHVSISHLNSSPSGCRWFGFWGVGMGMGMGLGLGMRSRQQNS